MSSSFTILTVCTGNICRSPLAEQLIAQLSVDVPEIEVSSAGTHAMVGSPMSEQSQEIARSLGIAHPESHVPRALTADVLETADLVLAMARDHRRAIVEQNPRVTRRTFTIREFARLAEAVTDEDLRFDLSETSGDPVDRLRAAVSSVVLARPAVTPPADASEDDVIDPYGRGSDVYELSTHQLIPAVNATVGFLRRSIEIEI